MNRWLLISYKQLLHLAHVFASNVYGTIMGFGYGRMVLLIMMLIKLLMMVQVLMLLMIMLYLLVNLINVNTVKTLS